MRPQLIQVALIAVATFLLTEWSQGLWPFPRRFWPLNPNWPLPVAAGELTTYWLTSIVFHSSLPLPTSSTTRAALAPPEVARRPEASPSRAIAGRDFATLVQQIARPSLTTADHTQPLGYDPPPVMRGLLESVSIVLSVAMVDEWLAIDIPGIAIGPDRRRSRCFARYDL